MGAEAIKEVLKRVDIEKLSEELREKMRAGPSLQKRINFQLAHNGASFLQPPEQAVTLTGDERRGNFADVEFFTADARHVQQRMRLSGVEENGRYAFLFHELVPLAIQLLEPGQGSTRRWLPRKRRRSLHRKEHRRLRRVRRRWS